MSSDSLYKSLPSSPTPATPDPHRRPSGPVVLAAATVATSATAPSAATPPAPIRRSSGTVALTAVSSASSQAPSAPRRKVILSCDIEADGPSPATNSCRMIGIVVVDATANPLGKEDEKLRAEWVVDQRGWCLAPQPNRVADARTMAEFWSKNVELLKYIDANSARVETVMADIASWYTLVTEKYEVLHWACSPAAYDWQFVNALYTQYAPKGSPALPHMARCISSMKHAAKALGLNPQGLKSEKLPHTHNAVDDALQQAYEYLRVLRELDWYKGLLQPEVARLESLRLAALGTMELLEETGALAGRAAASQS